MSSLLRHNRKATDAEVIRLNNCGLSLQTIGKMLDIHPSTVTIRLRSLGIDPADTRRSFMEDVFRALPGQEREWLSDQLNSGIDVKTYVINLLRDKYSAVNQGKNNEQQPDSAVRGDRVNDPVVPEGEADHE